MGWDGIRAFGRERWKIERRARPVRKSANDNNTFYCKFYKLECTFLFYPLDVRSEHRCVSQLTLSNANPAAHHDKGQRVAAH